MNISTRRVVLPEEEACAHRAPVSRSLVDALGLLFAGVIVGFFWRVVFDGIAALVHLLRTL